MSQTLPNAPMPAEMELIYDLFRKLLTKPAEFPISFSLDGTLISGLPLHGMVKRRRIDTNIDEITFESIIKDAGIRVLIEMTLYKDYPVLEWVVWLKNEGDQPTPLIENLKAMDMDLEGTDPVLHHFKGDFYDISGFEPFKVPLDPGVKKELAPVGGRACDHEFPYYRIAFKDHGYTLAVGWPCQWASSFEGKDGGVHIEVGQQTVSLKLNPGEKIRTPRVTLLGWQRGNERAINLWRRWFLAHILPRHDGQPLKPYIVGHGADEHEEFTGATERNQIEWIEKFNRLQIPFDVWWIDAGWYPCMSSDGERRWWETGTWKPDPERFPKGFKPISDKLHGQDGQLLIWFEPERVRPGTELDQEHPELLLSSDVDDNKLLNLGDSKARTWVTGRILDTIKDGGIDVYRQDHNFPPLSRWQANDAEDRKGMNENLYVQGYLDFWDELLFENPSLWIDSCSAGGRRNDLETMRRSVPLHYTDYGYGDHAVKLAFQRTMHEWIPYFKEFTLSWDKHKPTRWNEEEDSFGFHCGMAPMLFPTFDIKRDDYDFELIRKMIGVWKQIADLVLYGDYYALTPFHKSASQWVAKQFDSPSEGRGYVQAIRLQECEESSLTVRLHAIDLSSEYELVNPETGETLEVSGKNLADKGLTVSLEKRQGQIWIYRRM